MSLRARIGGAAGLAVALTVLVAAVVVYVAVRSNLRGEVDRGLAERVDVVAERGGRAFGPGIAGIVPGRRPPPRERFGGAAGVVQLIDPTGAVHGSSSARLPVTDTARSVAEAGAGRAFEDVHARGSHLRMLTIGIGSGGAAQVARPLAEVDSVLDRVLVVLLLVSAVAIAVAVALGGVVARVALTPVARFTQRTESIAGAADLEERIEVRGDDELARLARTFNTTLDALQAAVSSQRQLVADASHELRTPIASLRANLQTLEHLDRLSVADREALRDDVLSELDELTVLVSDIVELARGSRPSGELEDVQLDVLVGELVARARRRAPELAHTTDLEPTVVCVDRERVARAISNLLDNARKWSPAAGVVEVVLRDGVLGVRDHGPGFGAGDLPHVFDRFYRSADARSVSGSGLGLAIVRQAAEAHGGWADAANAPGGGALVRVKF